MELLGCGHVARPGSGLMCRHLVATAGAPHARHLLGRGLDADYLCTGCDAVPSAAELVKACEGCFGRHENGCVAWRGSPGIGTRPEPVPTEVSWVDLPPVVDVAPIGGMSTSAWLLLLEGGVIARFEDGAITPEGVCDVPHGSRLHCSADGLFAAVVHDYGQHGQLLDLAAGTVRPLDGGDYACGTVPFSLAFDPAGRVVLRTDWHRLAELDARTGEEHRATDDELDYFHGRLSLSPGGRWIADDGWIWAPIGIVRVWDRDLTEYRDLCDRNGHWDSPMCWLGDDLLVVSGIGDDGRALLPGVRIFDVPTGTELTAFPGPAGELFAAGRRLFAACPSGLEIWDPFAGVRTGQLSGFHPRWQHRGAGELAGLSDGRLGLWRYGGLL